MAIVWCRYCPLERTHGGKHQDTATYEEYWLVRTDNPAEPMTSIRSAPGIDYLFAHPDDASCKALEFDVKPEGDSGLLYKVRVRYSVPPVDAQKQDEQQQEQPGTVAGIMKYPVWGASSSVTSGPCFEHYPNANDNGTKETICNSAGDPLESLEREEAGARLTLTQYYLSHAGWRGLQMQYTNAVNSDAWNGDPARTWKCQGCSARLQTENVDGVTVVFWEVNWEFEYRADTWDLKPWDVGFAQLVDETGEPYAYGELRAQIKGQDGKPVRQPVALNVDGTALPAGTKPLVINNGAGVRVYHELDFGQPFGQIFTPAVT